ncbi:DNA recombination protein RmuC [Chryseobacterium aquaticum]|uniref:DNA recombination protein RmuC n=1 Tax=Chryseobacterium aquaticum TaxID=452084 RepID=A0A848N5U8_9FLAO|nr:MULTISPECIES: DNA recombination protein RmuC [Chryseobacterium]NMR33881.1 DNA recombination protein RmuC [Chryseobacterium aquaticum]NRQ45956.1 DNA recombination protein RmuC [Chryseobacterium sp. C-204]
METTYLIIGFISGGILGAVVLYFILKSSMVSRNSYDELNHLFIKSNSDLENSTLKINELSQNIAKEKEINLNQSDLMNDLKAEFAKVSAENTFLKAQKEETKRIQKEGTLQFENLANKILEEKSEKFTLTNKQNLDTLLKPLGENLESFKKRVNEVYENEARERHSLNSTIKLMLEQTTKVSQEANNLANALKGQTKTQGDWGEMILERILEDSGLTKDREYFKQQTIKNEDGDSLRPDFTLKLPGNQLVIIDSKVSLNAYEKMNSSESDEEKEQLITLHIGSIKRHIDDLSRKRYDHISESLDFTIMFIPIEPAFLVAVQHDQNLWNYAYSRHVILVSPTNLIAFLKLISDLWKRDNLSQNALKISEAGAKLYDKLVGFVDNLEKVGKNMDLAQKSYSDAFSQLYTGRGNLIKRAEDLKNMGLQNKINKSLPQNMIDTSENQIDLSE